MDNTHVKLDYINGSVKVSALSSEAKNCTEIKIRESIYILKLRR